MQSDQVNTDKSKTILSIQWFSMFIQLNIAFQVIDQMKKKYHCSKFNVDLKLGNIAFVKFADTLF